MNSSNQFTCALALLALSGASCAPSLAQPPGQKQVAKQATAGDETPKPEAVTLPGLSVALDAAHPIFVVQPGQEDKVALVVKNSANAPQTVTMHVAVESYDGSVIKRDAALTVPAKGQTRWQLPREMFGKMGIKWVMTTLEANGARADMVRSSLAYMVPSGPAQNKPGDFIFGIGYGSHPDNANPKAALATSLIGVQAVRDGVNWRNVQPKAGEWNWDRPDKVLAVNSAAGLDTQWILSGTVGWAVLPEYKNSPERDYSKPPIPSAWREFVAASARRYTDKARYWEIWNEPDIGFFNGTVEQYLELQRIAYEEIKKADPKQQVLSGGFASMRHGKSKPGMVERTLREGNFDAVAYHQHGEFKGFQAEIDGDLLPLMKKTGHEKTPIYFTETASDTRYGERFQAETLVKKLTFAWARGAIAYTWFNLHDFARAKTPTSPGHTYGLYTNGDNPKASYATYNTLTGLLRGKKFVKQYELPGNQWAFLFADAGEQVVVAWNESGSRGGSQLVLSSDAAQIENVDLMGNRTPASALEKRVLWPIEASPRYLVLRGAKTQPTIAGSLVATSDRFSALPGKTLKVSAQLSNPLAEAREFNLGWKLPREFGGTTIEKKVTVAPNSNQTVAVEMPIPADYKAKFGSGETVNLNYKVAGTPWNGTLAIPVEMGALSLPTEFGQKPTFVLDDQEQVTNLTEADPNTEYLLWRDKADLSARIYLARQANSLKIRVVVRDDAFSQESTNRFWDGDSIQLALQVPGQMGAFELTLADMKGEPVVQNNGVPQGVDVAAFKPNLQIERDGANRTYELTLPDAMTGISGAQWSQGVRFNLLVNDNDGRGRKGYIAVAPGIGNGFDATRFPLLVAAK